MAQKVFISCGQYTEAEKNLGKRIAEMVRSTTNLEPFFAEEVQDLNGLDTNILSAMRDSAAFITILHPRGEIIRPDGSKLVRASIWIEQEIAIATYIKQVENRPLPIIAFKHKSVSLEGIRTLLHLNPIEFGEEHEVLAELPARLELWRPLKSSEIELQLVSKSFRQHDGHKIRWLETVLVNETNNRIDHYELEVRLPSSVLKHFNYDYPNEVPCEIEGLRCFRFDQLGFGAIRPHDRKSLAKYEYCIECAIAQRGGGIIEAQLIAESKLGARIWINGREYVSEKTIKQLSAGT